MAGTTVGSLAPAAGFVSAAVRLCP
jgi:hypothetical protein